MKIHSARFLQKGIYSIRMYLYREKITTIFSKILVSFKLSIKYIRKVKENRETADKEDEAMELDVLEY